ncbi:MAG: MTH1187 family thiamine-binding protein [Dehalococcoidales bacterium]|nr:MTH1187 family thiamine-binding protein [Dehalococcoidales bacterium]
MAIVDVSVIPLGTGTPSVSKYIAGAVKVLKKEKDLSYTLTAMGTTIEGRLPRLLDLAHKMHDSAFEAGAERVVTIIKIDERRDRTATIESKIESVKRQLV